MTAPMISKRASRESSLSLACRWLSGMLSGAMRERETARRRFGGAVIQQVGITPRLGEQLPLDLEFVDRTARRSGSAIAFRPAGDSAPRLLRVPDAVQAVGRRSVEYAVDIVAQAGRGFYDRDAELRSARRAGAFGAARELAIDALRREAVERGWHFLTGDEAAIAAVTDAVGFRYALRRRDEAVRARVRHLRADARAATVSRYLGGIDYSPRDLRLALVEASDGKIGTAADQVLLLCYMYDPTVGKYGLAIMTRDAGGRRGDGRRYGGGDRHDDPPRTATKSKVRLSSLTI